MPQYKKLVLWAIFVATLCFVLIAEATVMFPNLIMRTVSTIPEYFDINPFEPGIMAVPLLITNIFLLVFGILYFKGRLPKKIPSSVKFILNFEISKKIALITIVILVGAFVVFTASHLFTEEDFEDYRTRVKPSLESWTIDSVTKGYDLHLKYFLDNVSMTLFGSYRVIPYMASISLLVLTYFFTKLITKSRFAGIVSMILVLQSSIFLYYSSSVTYDNYWTLLYLLSLYAVYKIWPLSPISFVASVLTKPLTVVFLPFTFFFTFRSSVTTRRKILVIVSHLAIIAIAIVKFGSAGGITSTNTFGFWSAFNAFVYQMRFDPVVVLFLLSVTVMLFFAARRGVIHADSILLFLMGSILLQPLAATFTENASEPYRFMPLITFFAIGVGILLSKNINASHSKNSSQKDLVSPNRL